VTSGTVRAGGAQIAWRIDGEDRLPTLILSNSLGTDRSMWQSQVNVIKRRFRILRYDTRGHGASGAGNADYGIERLGRDVLAIMDGLGIARAHFCGLSLGGMTGMWLGVNAPERIDRLVLANTAAHIGPPDLWTQRADAVQKGGMQAIVEGVLKRWFTAGFLAGNGSVVEEARRMLLATPPEGYARACRMLAAMDQRETVAGVSAPTLVIAGLQDAATPPADAKFLVEKIRHAQLVELDAAHLSNMERANEFTRAVQHFLQS
jgi:3-oxoadipate enol-lactonase